MLCGPHFSGCLLNIDSVLDLSISVSDFVMQLIQPGVFFGIPEGDQRRFTLNGVIILDALWFARNRRVHNQECVNIQALILNVRRRYVDHMQSLAGSGHHGG